MIPKAEWDLHLLLIRTELMMDRLRFIPANSGSNIRDILVFEIVRNGRSIQKHQDKNVEKEKLQFRNKSSPSYF